MNTDERKTHDTSSQLPLPNDPRIHHASSEILREKALTDSNGEVLIRWVLEQPPFVVVTEGIDDALLCISSSIHARTGVHVVLCSPHLTQCQDLLLSYPNVDRITILPYTEEASRLIPTLLAVCRAVPNCVSVGLKSIDPRYAPLFDDAQRQRLTRIHVGRIAHDDDTREGRTKTRVVIHAHHHTVPINRSERAMLDPRMWNDIVGVCGSDDIELVITGSEELRDAYPAPAFARDERHLTPTQQRNLIQEADVLVCSDCPELIVAAMHGVTCFRAVPMRGHDLHGLLNERDSIVYPLWNSIRSFNDVRTLRALMDQCGLRPSSLVESGVALRHRTGLQSGEQLSSFHSVFWDRSYDRARRVLIRSSTAVGDSLIITGVISALHQAHPHLEIDVTGPAHILDLYRTHPHVTRTVIRGSVEELVAERDADEVVEYNHIVDRLPEYYHGIHLYDIMANLAGVKNHSRDIVFVPTAQEEQGTEEVIRRLRAQTEHAVVMAVQLVTEKDVQRSYPHARTLVSSMLEEFENLCIVNLGTVTLDVQHPRYMEASAVEGWRLRDHISVVQHCDRAMTIDSAFFHVAHNLWKHPTLMVQSITNECLVANVPACTAKAIRNARHGCAPCYWNSGVCKKNCLATFGVDEVMNEVRVFMKECDDRSLHALSAEFEYPHCPYDTNAQALSAIFMRNISERRLIRPTVMLNARTPQYVRGWNGVDMQDDAEATPAMQTVKSAAPTERTSSTIAWS